MHSHSKQCQGRVDVLKRYVKGGRVHVEVGGKKSTVQCCSVTLVTEEETPAAEPTEPTDSAEPPKKLTW